MPRIAEGRKAPAFTLEDAAGRRVSLADFQGKDVIVIRLTVWPGPDGTVRKHWARAPDAAKQLTRVLEAVRREAA